MMPLHPPYTIRALHRAFRHGDTTPSILTEQILARCAGSPRGILTDVFEERALREAAASTRRWQAGQPLGLFDGIPCVWKDLFDVAGSITTAGSPAYRHRPPATADAPLVAAFSRAGGVNIGKAGLSELAYSGLGINPVFGTPPNPFDPRRIPGGSSSGSAAAVQAGLCAFSMGSDTSGSIRIPSAFHHLTGYKPSRRRFDQRQVFPLSATLDEVGPIAAGVQDCYDAANLFSGRPCPLLQAADWRQVLLLVPENAALWADTDAAVYSAFQLALRRFAAAGAAVCRTEIAELDAVTAAVAEHGTFAAAESLYFHREVLAGEGGRLIDQRVLDRMCRAKSMSALDYVALHDIRRRLQHSLWQRYPQHTVLLPTVAVVPPLLAPLESDAAHYHRINLLVLRNTGLFNFLDAESLSLPLGFSTEGLPVGLMLSTAPGQDERLFQVARAAERLLAGED
ncbi:MAG: amidase family protein [Eikenella sp.]|nr:amidase family protein [Eikenella sp.]